METENENEKKRTCLYKVDDAVEFLAEQYGMKVSPMTLRTWKHRGRGPRTVKIVGRVYYRERDLVEWVERQIEEGLEDNGQHSDFAEAG